MFVCRSAERELAEKLHFLLAMRMPTEQKQQGLFRKSLGFEFYCQFWAHVEVFALLAGD
jgi:hypothetical protein